MDCKKSPGGSTPERARCMVQRDGYAFQSGIYPARGDSKESDDISVDNRCTCADEHQPGRVAEEMRRELIEKMIEAAGHHQNADRDNGPRCRISHCRQAIRPARNCAREKPDSI